MNSVSAGLPFYLSKGLPKRDTFDIYLTTCFGVRKFKNTSAMGDIVFLKMFKIESKFTKCKKKMKQKLFVSEIIASENVAINSLY